MWSSDLSSSKNTPSTCLAKCQKLQVSLGSRFEILSSKVESNSALFTLNKVLIVIKCCHYCLLSHNKTWDDVSLLLIVTSILLNGKNFSESNLFPYQSLSTQSQEYKINKMRNMFKTSNKEYISDIILVSLMLILNTI